MSNSKKGKKVALRLTEAERQIILNDLIYLEPDLDAIVAQPGHQDGGREQQQLLAGAEVEIDRAFLEVETRHATEQPATQRPGRIIF